MSSLLRQAGVDVKGIILIDSPSPFTDQVLPDALIDAVLGKLRRQAPASDERTKTKTTLELAKIQMQHSSRALVSFDPCRPHDEDAESGTYPKAVMVRCTSPVSMSGAGVSWACVPFLDDRHDPRTMTDDWESLVGCRIPVLDVPGNHFEMFENGNVRAAIHPSSSTVIDDVPFLSQIHALSEKLLEALAIFEGRG